MEMTKMYSKKKVRFLIFINNFMANIDIFILIIATCQISKYILKGSIYIINWSGIVILK